MTTTQPKDHLDNDKEELQEILYEFLNQFKEEKYLSQGNTDQAVEAIDQYTQKQNDIARLEELKVYTDYSYWDAHDVVNYTNQRTSELNKRVKVDETPKGDK